MNRGLGRDVVSITCVSRAYCFYNWNHSQKCIDSVPCRSAETTNLTNSLVWAAPSLKLASMYYSLSEDNILNLLPIMSAHAVLFIKLAWR